MNSTNLADLLERVLDKGVMIAGDVRIQLLDIELLTIQLRLVVCSIDKAKEMGMDWWANSPLFHNENKESEEEVQALRERVATLEAALRGDDEAAQRVLSESTPPAVQPPETR
jgi:hypothetical protein